MEIPAYITTGVLAVAAFAVLATPLALAGGTGRIRLGAPFAVGVGVILGGWLLTTSILALDGAYDQGEPIPAVAIPLVVGLLGFGLAVTALPRLRAALGEPAMQPRLVALQAWRVLGLAFLALFGLGQLPALFAVPAGLGDAAIGLTAPWMARNLHRRRLAIGWHLFGLADLVMAVTLGATTTPGAAQLFFVTPSSAAMTAFPMAIIPTFLVPLSISLHLVGLRYLLFGAGRAATDQRPVASAGMEAEIR